jgi:hypothetical protein
MGAGLPLAGAGFGAGFLAAGLAGERWKGSLIGMVWQEVTRKV